jgi:uncharacterized ferritin-like protein (DUF455 family)
VELREWALHLLGGANLEDKLFDPGTFTDHCPGPVYFFDEPMRSARLKLGRRDHQSKLAPFHDHHLERARINCLHRFCGHELLAVELLAFALLAYPQAPRRYRLSLVHHIQEEQGHIQLYRKRLMQLGADLGDEPLYRHFWASTGYLHTFNQFISYMNLTLEQANLDFAPLYMSSFAKHGDYESAKVMAIILKDEIDHVRLGMHWLKTFHKGINESELLEKWISYLPPTTNALRAKGSACYTNPRKLAGIPDSWLEQICPDKNKRVAMIV